jgi:hypothetical protein
MWNRALAILLFLSLAACATAPPRETEAPPRRADAGGDRFLAVLGTPFLIALKIPVCVVSVAVAAPLAGASAFGGEGSARATRRVLGEGIEQNCGPPYVLSP